jgi:hypothetical protein
MACQGRTLRREIPVCDCVFHEVLLSGCLLYAESEDILLPFQNSKSICFEQKSMISTMGQRTMSHVCNLCVGNL